MSDRPRSNPPIPGSGPTEPDAAQPKTAQLHVGCMMFGRWGINNPRSVERIVHQALQWLWALRWALRHHRRHSTAWPQ